MSRTTFVRASRTGFQSPTLSPLPSSFQQSPRSPTLHSRRRHASFNAAPPRKRRGLKIAVLTVAAAAGIGAYLQSANDGSKGTLNPLTFTEFELISKQPVSSTISLFSLRPKTPDSNKGIYEQAWAKGLWSVLFKQPQLQIGRDYTPLPPANHQDGRPSTDETLRFLIRRDPHGEVSGYLHDLPLGSTLDMRGPQPEYSITSNIDDVLFIAGGTGIAPALQTAHCLFEKDGDKSAKRLHILWANRRREDCAGGTSDLVSMKASSTGSWWTKLFCGGRSPQIESPGGQSPVKNVVVEELEQLKAQYPGRLTVDYFVDEEGTFIGKEAILNFTNPTQGSSNSPRKRIILVSGPDSFIAYMAGPKSMVQVTQGREAQGPLRGLLKQLDLRGWTVWKL